jgi:periplasmic protein TonB
MTNRDNVLRRRVLLLVLMWCASTLPGFATEPAPGGVRLSKRGDSRFAWYAAQLQSSIKEALNQNNKTRTASISGVVIRIWVDNTAPITRAELVGTLGDPSLDRAITNEVLPGLQLKAPPPSDMPMPIVVRVTTHRPN